jgi:uncharacterized integral membrane protein
VLELFDPTWTLIALTTGFASGILSGQTCKDSQEAGFWIFVLFTGALFTIGLFEVGFWEFFLPHGGVTLVAAVSGLKIAFEISDVRMARRIQRAAQQKATTGRPPLVPSETEKNLPYKEMWA